MYDTEYVVHPQIAQMMLLRSDSRFGAYVTPSELLAHRRRLVLDREDPSEGDADDAWDEGLALPTEFAAREGHARPPRGHVERGAR
jgi:hypothetical protein